MNQDFLNVFLDEAQEHLQSLNENILKLESDPEDISVVGEIFRSAHTFKGMSATMGFEDIANLTHEMENVLDDIRNSKLSVTEAIIDVVLECIENLENMVIDVQHGGNGSMDVTETVNKLKEFRGAEPTTVSASSEQPSLQLSDKATHIVHVNLNEDCMLKSVRVVMVLDALKEIGEIIETSPSQEELETEEFGSTFSIAFSTIEDSKEIETTVLSVSEIESAQVEENNKENEEELPTEEVKIEPDISKNEPSAPKPDTQKKSPQRKVEKKFENKTIRVNLDKIEDLMNMFEETVIERGRIEEIVYSLDNQELHERVQRLDAISKDLQNLVLNMRMVPIETVFNRFPRMVRQLAKDLNKSIDLVIQGEDTEIDRIVIDEIGDPLVHLIRNSVDHGVETREERIEKGKSEKGKVLLRAFHSGNNIVIEITDDGKGINKSKVLEKAIKNNIITEAEGAKLSINEAAELIFEPGFSTADVISDISGRGVGLDVVKTTITKLGGNVTVRTEEGRGSTFRIELPLTLSIIQSMLVATKGNRYAIPLGNIVETMRVPLNEIQNLQGKDVINYRDKIIPVIALSRLFHNKTKEEWISDLQGDNFQVVIIRSQDRVYALAVDEIFGQREIVLKSLGSFFKDGAQYFSGATILGDGQVVLILDCDKINSK